MNFENAEEFEDYLRFFIAWGSSEKDRNPSRVYDTVLAVSLLGACLDNLARNARDLGDIVEYLEPHQVEFLKRVAVAKPEVE